MAKRLSREEKAAEAAAEQRTRKVNEFKARVAKEQAKTVYSEKLVWEGNDKGAQALYELVRRFESAGEDMRKRTESLAEDLQRALAKLAANEHDVYGCSNPVTRIGSDIETYHTTRKVLADAVALMSGTLGYYVPQIHSERYRANRAKLVGVEVGQYVGGTTWCISVNGNVLTGVDLGLQPADAAMPLVSEYLTYESAWLAAAEYVGDYWRA